MKELKNYRVAWKSLRTGATGQGDRLMTENDARAWANELNSRPENKYLRHWIESIDQRRVSPGLLLMR